jgi:hypothetical protein
MVLQEVQEAVVAAIQVLQVVQLHQDKEIMVELDMEPQDMKVAAVVVLAK